MTYANALDADGGFRLAVLNPGGRDPEQDFSQGAGKPGGPGHSPINFHGYAACTRGSFHRDIDAALATGRPVLLLLRRDLKGSLRALRRVRSAGRKVAVTFKEAGSAQVATRIVRPADVRLLREIVAEADGCISPTPWLEAFFAAMAPMQKRCEFIPTPYPLDDPQWDFGRPAGERAGILIGTREFDTPSRQHLAAVTVARRLHEITGERVTVFNADGRRGARMLAELGFAVGRENLRVLNAPLPYAAYLREMAGHKLVFQLDRSGVPGQVAGDALLCRIPCVGGDGATEQVAFAGLCGNGRSAGKLAELARQLFENPAEYEAACADSLHAGREHLGNSVIAARLAAFFQPR